MKMTCSFTSDLDLVASIVGEPRCRRRMRNDADLGPLADPRLLEMAYRVGGVAFVVVSEPQPVGVFVLCNTPEARFPEAAEVYQCVSPSVWGRTEAIARGWLDWVWRETGIRKLIAHIPTYNRLSLRLAKRVGFREIGLLERLGTKNGREFGSTTLAIDRPLNAHSA